MMHHQLDPYPIPREESPLYINEPWVIDKTLLEYPANRNPEETDDNIRIYAPLDLNKSAILRRLNKVVTLYGEANEENESEFRIDVDMLIAQFEIYDQIWRVRHMSAEGAHSREAIDLVKTFVTVLETIPDGCAERFPFETINELKKEYLAG